MSPPKLLRQLGQLKGLFQPNSHHDTEKSRQGSSIPSTIYVELEECSQQYCDLEPPWPLPIQRLPRVSLSKEGTSPIITTSKQAANRDRCDTCTTLQTNCSSVTNTSSAFLSGSCHQSVRELERHRQHPTTVAATQKAPKNPLVERGDNPKVPGSPTPQSSLLSLRKKKPELSRASNESDHNESLSFRIRKRNKALSNIDFGHLLDISRGWTFDPSNGEIGDIDQLEHSSHNERSRNHAYSQDDFERFIFEPPHPMHVSAGGTIHGESGMFAPDPVFTTRSLRKDAMSCVSCSSVSSGDLHRSASDLERQEAIHPLLRPNRGGNNGATTDETTVAMDDIDDRNDVDEEPKGVSQMSTHAPSVVTMASF